MSIERNKAVVHRFFEEVLDGGNMDLMLELFASDAVVHRPEVPAPIVGNAAYAALLSPGLARRSHFVTTIEYMIGEDDLVAVRLRHDVTYIADIPSRVGMLKATGKSIHWYAHAFFRVRDGKIVEEWVQRDEAGILQQLGGLQAAAPAS